MKARTVKHLDPDGTLADNAQRVVSVRIDELYDFVPSVLNPKRVKKLHEMRIAAKRLRYVLEVTSSVCFGPYALTATKRVRELQDLLGEIHDCDIQLPRVQQIRAELSEDAVAELSQRAGGAADLDPALASGLSHSEDWAGLAALEHYLAVRRGLLYERFLTVWQDIERSAMRARLDYAIAERPSLADSETEMNPII
jgi:hypothetical protein